MAEKTATTDDATLDDLTNEPVTVGFEVRGNNETVKYYPGAPGAELGVVKHKYDGFPARGVVLYDVVGYEIVDYEFETHDDDMTMDEEFELFEGSIREWLDDLLFSAERTRASGHIQREGTHTWTVEHPHEDEVYTVELQTENKRRVRG